MVYDILWRFLWLIITITITITKPLNGLKNEFFSRALPGGSTKIHPGSHGSHGASLADRVHCVVGAGIRRGHGAARGRQVEDRGTTNGGRIESSLIDHIIVQYRIYR